MGYQVLFESSVTHGLRPLDAILSRRLTLSTAPPRRASPARHGFDSRMGYQILLATGAPQWAASFGRNPFKAAPFKHGSAAARLSGATRVRFPYGLPDPSRYWDTAMGCVLWTQPFQGGSL